MQAAGLLKMYPLWDLSLHEMPTKRKLFALYIFVRKKTNI